MTSQTDNASTTPSEIDNDHARTRTDSDSADLLTPQLSVVIPVLNEEENVGELCSEIRRALESSLRYEIVFVDDGSTDGTADVIRGLMNEAPVRLLRHSHRSGQSAAVRTGVKAALAPWVATLDGDGQNDPQDLMKLWNEAHAGSPVALAMGNRKKRQDSFVKRMSSRIANRVRSGILGDHCPDSGCGIKIFDRDAFLDLPWFDHMHRFLPALFESTGRRVVFVPVNHRPRSHGVSKYGVWDRLWVGIVDLFGVVWLKRRSKSMTVVVEEEEEEA